VGYDKYATLEEITIIGGGFAEVEAAWAAA
jgi:folate-dependent tRNA-U54 methylase TrmFO/GidA